MGRLAHNWRQRRVSDIMPGTEKQTAAGMAQAESDANQRYWVRNEVGRVWGPFGLDTLRRLDPGAGDLRARFLVSTDGLHFVPITQRPEALEALNEAAILARQARMEASRTAAARPASRPLPRRASDVRARSQLTPPPVMGLPVPGTPAPGRVIVTPASVANKQEEGIPLEGGLDLYSTVELYVRAASGAATGCLRILGRESWSVHFRKGTPHWVEGPQSARSLARYLSERRLIPTERLQAALDAIGGPDGDLVGVLVSRQLMPPQELFRVLGEYQVRQLGHALALESGTFTFEDRSAPPPGSFALGHRWGLLCEWIRHVPLALVARRLGDRLHRNVYRSSAARVALSELHLTPQEARVAQRFDGTRTPARIAAEYPSDAGLIQRLAWLFGETAILSFGALSDDRPSAPVTVVTGPTTIEDPVTSPVDQGVAEAQSTDPHRTSPHEGGDVSRSAPVAKRAVSRPPPRSPEQELRAARSLLESWSKADHYKVLGVKTSASAADVKTAFVRLARQHHPDTVIAQGPELMKLKADITARLNEAYSVLHDEEARAEYARVLAGEAATVDVGPILQAEEDFQRACVLVKARRYQEGIELLERAIQLNPDEGEFLAWRAFARFVISNDRRSAYPDAVAECERALKMNPRCAQAHLFIGQMAKLIGENTKAFRAYKGALGVDPENIEAQRELRLAAARGQR